jgi:hypothetical protein
MIIIALRIICLILLIFAILVDIEIPLVLHTQVNQLIIAIIIIIILLLVDEIVGFLLGLIFLIIYFKYYQRKLNNTNIQTINTQTTLKEPLITDKFNNISNDVKPVSNQKTEPIENHYIKEGYNCLEMPYISKELLEKAQNNIYDINNYNINIDIQGLANENIQAYDGFHYSKL